MNTVDFGFWIILATGIAIGIVWERREAVVDWFASRLEDEPVRRELPRSHPSVKVLRGPADWQERGWA